MAERRRRRRAGDSGESLWRNRDFVLLWTGQVVSTLGTRMSALALPLLVLAKTGSASRAGLAGFVAGLPYVLFYLPAGALIDRCDRRRVMLVCEAGRIVALGSIPVALWTDLLTFTQILVAGFVGGTFFVFLSVAEKAVVPALVSKRQLPAALAQQEAKTKGAALAGQPLGGLLYGVSRPLPFLADALSYALSLITVLFIRSDLRVRRTEPVGSMAGEIWDGLRWLWAQRFVRITTVLVALVNLVVQALMLVLIVLTDRLGASSGMIGLVLGCYAGGGLAGSFAATWLQRRLSPKTVAIGATWIWAALLAALATVPAPAVLGVILALMGFVGPVWNVVVVGYQYRVIPDHMLGRVKSVALLVAWGAIPFGPLAGGCLLELTSPRGALLALAAFSLLIAIIATTSPGIRREPALAIR